MRSLRQCVMSWSHVLTDLTCLLTCKRCLSLLFVLSVMQSTETHRHLTDPGWWVLVHSDM